MPGQLAGTLGMPVSQARHAAPWFSLRTFVIILIVVAVIIILLAGPVVFGALSEALSRGAERAMPGTFFTGLGILFVGIIVGVEIITFIGLGLVGAVIIGWIIDNYLTARARACSKRTEREKSASEAMEPERPVHPFPRTGSRSADRSQAHGAGGRDRMDRAAKLITGPCIGRCWPKMIRRSPQRPA